MTLKLSSALFNVSSGGWVVVLSIIRNFVNLTIFFTVVFNIWNKDISKLSNKHFGAHCALYVHEA